MQLKGTMSKLNVIANRHPCIKCINSLSAQNVARPTSSLPVSDEPKFLKFKKMVTHQIEKAQRSVLLAFRKTDNPQTLDLLPTTRLYQRMMNNNRVHTRDIKSTVKVSDCLYLVEFTRGRIPLYNKIMATMTPNFMNTASGSELNGTNLTRIIHNLYHTQRLPQEVISAHYFVAAYVQSLLLKFENDPDLKVLPFGSTASDLALKYSSDLDLVCLSKNLAKETDDYRDDLGQAAKWFHKDVNFRKVFPVLEARVPILKFQFKPFQTNCDLSRGLITGPLMAEILFWLNEYDQRFYKLMLAVKLLAKVNKVTGSADHRISSNTLTMLVVAFLQTKDILPPLKEVFDFRIMTDSAWETTYLNECQPKLECKQTMASVGELFQEFLIFYKHLPFSDVCIDVFNGEIPSVSNGRGMMVINPFDFEHNMAKNVTYQKINLFQTLCSDTLFNIASCPSDKFSRIWNQKA